MTSLEWYSMTIKPGIYQHYNGNRYRVIGVGLHSETKEELVVYIALYESELGKDVMWVRPRSMFEDIVIIDGKKVPRFQSIDKR